jgi:hypothetical protein
MTGAEIAQRTQLDPVAAPAEPYKRSGERSPRTVDSQRRGIRIRSVVVRRWTDPARRSPRTTRWAVTIAATALSTYVLEAVATAAGIALAASHVLRGLDQVLLLGFLGYLCHLGRRPASQPQGELGAARPDGDEHQRALKGRA